MEQTGVSTSYSWLIFSLDYEALDLFLLKENDYKNSKFFYMVTCCLILVFSIAFFILFVLSYKFFKLNKKIKEAAADFKNSFASKSLFSEHVQSIVQNQGGFGPNSTHPSVIGGDLTT